MYLKEIESFTLSGISVRTSNQNEMNPATAKIGDLWGTFYSEFGKRLTENSNVYGVYTDYESDFSGRYNVYAASDIFAEYSDLSQINIVAGEYLVFSAHGEVPHVVIDLWGHIWEHFSNKDLAYERAYTTDFEHFKKPTAVDIYIAIKNK